MTCRVLASFTHALTTLETVMHKRRLAANEVALHCVREDAEGDRCEAEIIVEVDYQPGDREYGPSRSWEARGCQHVATYTDEEREQIDNELDDWAREQGERGRDDE